MFAKVCHLSLLIIFPPSISQQFLIQFLLKFVPLLTLVPSIIIIGAEVTLSPLAKYVPLPNFVPSILPKFVPFLNITAIYAQNGSEVCPHY
jgi:hypothetical protein